MSKARFSGIVLGVLGVIVVALGIRFSRVRRNVETPVIAESRIVQLQQMVEQDRAVTEDALNRYTPRLIGRLDDPAVNAGDVLQHLPGVVEVQPLVHPAPPTHRIVHLRDWHFVPKDLYSIDLRSSAGRELSDEEVDACHQELLLEVEVVQLEQIALLRCLIRHHGLRRIFAEGLTPKDLPNYKDRVSVLKNMEQTQVPELRQQLEAARELKRGMTATGKEKTERFEQTVAIEREIVEMLEQHQHRLLEMGAAGRLLIAGEIEEVLPLDDADWLEQAKPITPSGMIRFDKEKIMARQDAQVKAALRHGPFALIILGGAHDLSDSVKRLGDGRCQYIRVTTRRVKEFMASGKE